MTDDLVYWVWLSSIPGIGAVKLKKLLAYVETPKRLWNLMPQELNKIKILSESNIHNLSNIKLKESAKKKLDIMIKYNIEILTIQDPTYPDYLKNIYDPPIMLFRRGNLSPYKKIIAVVGSRNASYYGLDTAKELSYQLAKQGVVVISGMARGVDSFAHKGALNGGGETIAVLGCGVDIVYPYENRKLMNDIINKGAIISEYFPGSPPAPHHFPARNRIISGMSMGVVVVEAGEKSGSLITANFALEQGREVFAVPGRINNKNSVGVHNLIKDGAKLISGVEDILEEFNYIKEDKFKIDKKEIIQRMVNGLTKEEIQVLECLESSPIHIDKVAEKVKLKISTVNSILIMLEIKDLIEQLPGRLIALKDSIYFSLLD